ncbi:MAG: type II toxin-antitoxin system VapC family toxin [Candidatus Levyibacteriota bacterium]
MITLILDTSVIIKFLNHDNERDVDKADEIFKSLRKGEVQVIAPELTKYEIGNVLIKKQLATSIVKLALETIYSLPITFVAESEELARETYLQAYKNKMTYYDAAFISLAKQYNATLITENIKHQGKTSDVNVIALKDY